MSERISDTLDPKDCPDPSVHGNPFRYCPYCSWRESPEAAAPYRFVDPNAPDPLIAEAREAAQRTLDSIMVCPTCGEQHNNVYPLGCTCGYPPRKGRICPVHGTGEQAATPTITDERALHEKALSHLVSIAASKGLTEEESLDVSGCAEILRCDLPPITDDAMRAAWERVVDYATNPDDSMSWDSVDFATLAAALTDKERPTRLGYEDAKAWYNLVDAYLLDALPELVAALGEIDRLRAGLEWADRYIRFVGDSQGIKFAPGEIAAYALKTPAERSVDQYLERYDKTEEAH